MTEVFLAPKLAAVFEAAELNGMMGLVGMKLLGSKAAMAGGGGNGGWHRVTVLTVMGPAVAVETVCCGSCWLLGVVTTTVELQPAADMPGKLAVCCCLDGSWVVAAAASVVTPGICWTCCKLEVAGMRSI